MLFNSFQFLIFFIIVYVLYLALRHKWQNRMLLVASAIFYGSWDWRFLCLMYLSISTDYICAKYIHQTSNPTAKKRFLFVSLAVNLIILGFFKYCNFFADNLYLFLEFLGIKINLRFLSIVLPVGISFYTFQAIGYVVDVYRKKVTPVKNFFDYALFVTYFPQLVAGPIERAEHLLPQILSPRRVRLEGFYEGCYLIAYGLWQKLFIADNLGRIVNHVFNKGPYEGALVLIATYSFAFQIYCDFSGYSNIARGLGKCMGFDIMTNFNLPYFATNPREFWQRWHISLSTWLRDYLYIPLGGNRRGTRRTHINLMVTMLLGGLWHGAQWTFVLWGAYHGLLLSIHRFFKSVSRKSLLFNTFQKTWDCVKILFFFHLVCFGWLIFRAESVSQATAMFKSLFLNFPSPQLSKITYIQYLLFFITPLLLIEIGQFIKKDSMFIYKLQPIYNRIDLFYRLYFINHGGCTGWERIYLLPILKFHKPC